MDQVRGSNIVNIGIDLSEFYLSVEWDILEVPATRNEEYYLPQVSRRTIYQWKPDIKLSDMGKIIPNSYKFWSEINPDAK